MHFRLRNANDEVKVRMCLRKRKKEKEREKDTFVASLLRFGPSCGMNLLTETLTLQP